jgi:hypothetical protein
VTRPVEREREREAKAPTVEDAPAAAARRTSAVLALQRSAGNQAVTRALLHRAPKDPPDGVTLPADPLPAGANVADPDAARIVDDPSLGGGWNDKNGKSESGHVGGVDRILLEGMPGNQQQQSEQEGAPAHGKDVADTAGAGPGLKGRAIAIVPNSLKGGPGGEVAVLVHFHGIGKALRERGDNPRDVDHYQVEQQLDAFVAANPGTRIVALLPIGVQTENKEGKHGVSFGNFDTDAFVTAAFAALGGALPSGAKQGDVILSAHSGGGLQLGAMLTSGKGLPGRMKGVFLFEALHGDTDNYIRFVTGRLDTDLKALEDAQATGVFDSDIFKAQAAYLQTSLHVVAFGGGTKGYKEKTLAIRDAVLKWWEKNAKRLRAATDPHTVLLDTLWAHYQAQSFPGSTHENALAASANNLGRALASLEKTGALAPAAPAAKATVAPKRRLARAPWELSSDPVTVVKADEKKKRSEVTAAPSDFVPAIISDAKVPADWLSKFKSTTFLGKSVGEPIHEDLVAHLKTVEASFATKYGGGSPEEAGKALGLRENVIGSRHAPTSAALSMHLFGLAIDVNYATNPFISASANPVFDRANKQLGRTVKTFRNGMTYDEIAELDKLLEDYFALLKVETTDASTKKQIQKDLTFVTDKWQRSEPAKKAAIEAGGLLDLDKRLVEEIGLDWGASYGDVMHFDMRNKGKGVDIHAAIERYRAKKEGEAEAQYTKDHPPPEPAK